MEVDFSIDNILDSNEIETLFGDNLNDGPEDTESTTSQDDSKKDEKSSTTEKIDGDTVFASEGVSSEESEDNQKDTSLSQKEGKDDSYTKSDVSPTHFYSSIAQAFRDDDIFPDLSDEDIKNIKNAEDFAEVVEKQIEYKLDATQKRINDALNANVEVSEVSKYENIIKQLDSISVSQIEDETDKGEELRKSLIYQDYINKGYSVERAKREVQKSFNTGNDITDAKESLDNIRESIRQEYDQLIEKAKIEKENSQKELKKQAELLKKSIIEDKIVMGDIQLDQNTKKKVYDNISKPIYRDPDSGELLTAIQKYERENHLEFMKNLGIIYTLTNGFKNFEGLLKGSVNRAVKKSIKELENTINNTSRASDGSLRYISGVDNDLESFSIDV